MSMRDLLRARSEAPLEALELGPLIGRGSFGRVYKGQHPCLLLCLCFRAGCVSALLASASHREVLP